MAILPIAEYEEFIKQRDEREKSREERLEQFRQVARRIGENIETLGLTDEEIDAQIEAARKDFHRRKNDDKAAR